MHNKQQRTDCPKILLTGACTNKSCTFRHNIYSCESASASLGNDGQFWLKDVVKEEDSFTDEEELKQNQNQYRNVRYHHHRNSHHRNNKSETEWKPAAYYSFKQ
eukprot:497049_1